MMGKVDVLLSRKFGQVEMEEITRRIVSAKYMISRIAPQSLKRICKTVIENQDLKVGIPGDMG